MSNFKHVKCLSKLANIHLFVHIILPSYSRLNAKIFPYFPNATDIIPHSEQMFKCFTNACSIIFENKKTCGKPQVLIKISDNVIICI